MHKGGILVLFCLISVLGAGQTVYPDQNRLELEYKYNEREYNIFNIEEEGLIVFRKKTGFFEMKEKNWEVKVLDTLLQIKGEFDVEVDVDYNLQGYDYHNGYFYLLFGEGYFASSDYHVFEIDIKTGNWEVRSMENELELELSHFIITNESVVFGGKVKNRPTVVLFSLEDETVEVLPGFFRNDTDIVNIRENINNTINILYLEKEQGTHNHILNLNVFNSDGSLLMEAQAKFDEDFRVLSGHTNELAYSDLVVTGTYGIKNNKLSQGLYFINFKPGKNNVVNLVPYTEFQNFFVHLGKRRQEKINERIQNMSPQKPYDFKTHFVIWGFEEMNDHYEVFGEIVDPRYDTSYRMRDMSRNYPGNYYYNPSSYETFSRYYQSSHSLLNKDNILSIDFESTHLIQLDKKGKYKNDFGMELDEQEKSFMESISSYYNSENGVYFLYKEEEEIRYLFDDGRMEQPIDSTIMVDKILIDQKLRNENEDGQIIYWYGNHFYVWGYQKLTEIDSNERKSVFYINRLNVK